MNLAKQMPKSHNKLTLKVNEEGGCCVLTQAGGRGLQHILLNKLHFTVDFSHFVGSLLAESGLFGLYALFYCCAQVVRILPPDLHHF